MLDRPRDGELRSAPTSRRALERPPHVAQDRPGDGSGLPSTIADRIGYCAGIVGEWVIRRGHPKTDS